MSFDGAGCILPFIMITNSKISEGTEKIVQGLQKVVDNSYALMALTHHAHWNIEGEGFFDLHKAFQGQYEELFEAIDEIAERIRALGHYAKGSVEHFAEAGALGTLPLTGSAEELVRGLLEAHQRLLIKLKGVRDVAAELGDKETEDLMIGRVQVHDKTVWMLESYLK